MTSNMLACYPEVFAGGAIVAGLPYGAATNVQQAFETMSQSPSRPAREWGDLVRKASSHRGPWPRISIWHGNVDKTVIPSNALEIQKQWTEVHGLPLSPSVKARIDGFPREVWINEAGDELIEKYTITNMAHGTPLAIGEARVRAVLLDRSAASGDLFIISYCKVFRDCGCRRSGREKHGQTFSGAPTLRSGRAGAGR